MKINYSLSRVNSLGVASLAGFCSELEPDAVDSRGQSVCGYSWRDRWPDPGVSTWRLPFDSWTLPLPLALKLGTAAAERDNPGQAPPPL